MSYFAIPFYWLAIFITYFYLHEFAGHYLANWLSSISPEQMEIIWAETNNVKIFPFAVNILGVEASEASIISRFSGGFMAGLLLLLLSIVFWRLCKKKGKGIYFCFFAVTLGFSFTGFTESIFEGFLLKYHRSTIETIILFIPFPLTRGRGRFL